MLNKKSVPLCHRMANAFLLLFLLPFFAGCGATIAPKLSAKDKEALEESKRPFGSNSLYSESLQQLGEVVGSNVDYRKVVQPKPIGNTAGGNELPLNLTNMVINSVSKMSSPKFVVVPYDPNYIISDFQTGGKGTRVLPDIIIGGSITEFDKDISGTSESINLDMLIRHDGTEMDIGLGLGNAKKMSRVVLDLYLLDYKTHAVIPGVSVSNTIHVLEIDKEREFGFAIWGSGLGIGGRIKHSQGFHKAIRNLVEYSILQLFGKYYDLPYWKLLGLSMPDQDVMRSLEKTFAGKSRQQQILEIQHWLQRYQLGPVVNQVNNRTYHQVPIDGILDPVTLAYIEKFLQQYSPGTTKDSLQNVYAKLIENGTFPSYAAAQRPSDAGDNMDRELADQKGQTKDSDNIILFKQ